MSSFNNFSDHHKDFSFESKCHPEQLLQKMNPLVGQYRVRIATFNSLFCVKRQSLPIYFNYSSGGVNFLVWYLTHFNSNPNGRVFGSLVDYFDQTRISAPCFPYQLQVDECIAKYVYQKPKPITQLTDQGVCSIGLKLYRTSFLSHILSIWCIVVSLLHFYTPTVYRTNLSACTKNALFGGVRRANTPNFCTFSHQSASREFPINFSNSGYSEFIFGPVRGTESLKNSIYSQ